MPHASPRYPLVLVPGLLGFVRLAGWPYWYGVVEALAEIGVQAIPVLVSPVHSTEVRGEQLLREIERIRRETGADRVHLIGHSHGGLTVRYAAALRPDWVASVTSLAGPHQGSEAADFIDLRCPPGSLKERLAILLTRLIAGLCAWLETGWRGPRLPCDPRAALDALTRCGVAAFNERFPQGLPAEWGGEGDHEVNGVRYYSWSGTLQPGNGQGRNRRDPSYWLCRLWARQFVREREANDGLVGRFSSHLGQVIRSDYPLDHLDIINQFCGRVPPGIDPLALFVEHARRLAEVEAPKRGDGPVPEKL